MNNQFSINVSAVKRIAYTMLAALLVVAGLPFFQNQKVSADQMANRSIQINDSAPSGGTITSEIGSGEGVTYRVSFDAVHAAGSMVIDFCDGATGPIAGEACTAPAGMDASAAVIVPVTGKIGTGTWADTSSANQVKLAITAASGDDVVGGSSEAFDITGITNPSTTGTFFARMYTYTNDTFGGYVDAQTVGLGPNSDYGGIALSITNVITITARVQESITFCVSKANPTTWTTTNDCSDTAVGAAPPAVTLGHSVGGTSLVLEPNAVDSDTIYSQMSTNATNGAVINLRSNPGGKVGSNAICGGLSADNGATCAIPPIGATAAAIVPGVENFGLFVSDSQHNAATPNSTGTITPSLIYNDQTNEGPTYFYGMDNSTAQAANPSALNRTFTGNVSSTFGSTIAATTGPLYRIENSYRFAATASLTTPAGLYTANMNMTATGSF